MNKSFYIYIKTRINYLKLLTCILTILQFNLAIILAQDYLIDFTGSGESTTVTTVKVENLTQGTSLEMNTSYGRCYRHRTSIG